MVRCCRGRPAAGIPCSLKSAAPPCPPHVPPPPRPAPPHLLDLLALEERGLVLSATALRFAYSAGGDGESNIKLDLRETAAFVRDPSARVNCVMLPFSCRMDLDMRVSDGLGWTMLLECRRARFMWAALVSHQPLRAPLASPHRQVPQAAEQGEVDRLHRAATVIQTHWRRHVRRITLVRRAAARAPAGWWLPALRTPAGFLGRGLTKRSGS